MCRCWKADSKIYMERQRNCKSQNQFKKKKQPCKFGWLTVSNFSMVLKGQTQWSMKQTWVLRNRSRPKKMSIDFLKPLYWSTIYMIKFTWVYSAFWKLELNHHQSPRPFYSISSTPRRCFMPIRSHFSCPPQATTDLLLSLQVYQPIFLFQYLFGCAES